MRISGALTTACLFVAACSITPPADPFGSDDDEASTTGDAGTDGPGQTTASTTISAGDPSTTADPTSASTTADSSDPGASTSGPSGGDTAPGTDDGPEGSSDDGWWDTEGFDTDPFDTDPFDTEGFDTEAFDTDFDPFEDCGDGVTQSWEECDGAELGGSTCQDYGFGGGQLSCDPDLCFLVVTDCTP